MPISTPALQSQRLLLSSRYLQLVINALHAIDAFGDAVDLGAFCLGLDWSVQCHNCVYCDDPARRT